MLLLALALGLLVSVVAEPGQAPPLSRYFLQLGAAEAAVYAEGGGAVVQALVDALLRRASGGGSSSPSSASAEGTTPTARVVSTPELAAALSSFVLLEACPAAAALLGKRFTLLPDSRLRLELPGVEGAGTRRLQEPPPPWVCGARSSWGLARIQARALAAEPPLPAPLFDATAPCVDVYVIDSGLDTAHPDFSPPATGGPGPVIERGVNLNVHEDVYGAIDPADTSDCNMHGTHVASTILGAFSGIASSAHVFPVRVLDCGGWTAISTLVEAVGWVIRSKQERGTPGVINLSIGGGRGPAPDPLDEALAAAVAAGVLPVVAAGNSFADACNVSPAWSPSALAVGATNASDGLACFGASGCLPGRGSNFGPCVDVWAPGEDICAAAAHTSGYRLLSGTSMAAPHVTAVVAQLLQTAPEASPEAIRGALLAAAPAGVLNLAAIPDLLEPGTPNRMLYSADEGFGSSRCGLVSPAPSATASPSLPPTLSPGLKPPRPAAGEGEEATGGGISGDPGQADRGGPTGEAETPAPAAGLRAARA